MNLQDAASNGALERVQLLLRQGVDKDQADSGGYTALWRAACSGYLTTVQCLIEEGADMEKGNNWGRTPLITASFRGHVNVVRYLLEQGADRDKADEDGETPLHDAAQAGNLETAMLLMSYGADLNARTNGGHLPIDRAQTEEMRQAQTPHGRGTWQTSSRGRPSPHRSYISFCATGRTGRRGSGTAEQQTTTSRRGSSRNRGKWNDFFFAGTPTKVTSSQHRLSAQS